jgi:hypothetical protein
MWVMHVGELLIPVTHKWPRFLLATGRAILLGSGSTAAAVREEARTGSAVGGRWHGPKAEQHVKALESWLKNHPTAASGDRAAAENLIKDMKNALSGK